VSPFGYGVRPADLATIPQPHGATADLGAADPGFDGSGDFFSYDSDLSPDATVGAYAGELLRAGFQDSGSIGSWRVFVGPTLTVWVRVGSGGPPTSLLVRVEQTSAADQSGPYSPTATPAAGVGDPATGRGDSEAGVDSPRATSKPVSQRRPDPPHGGSATASGGAHGGTGFGTSASPAPGGTVSGGGTSTGTGGGTSTGSGGSTGSSNGTSSGSGGYRP
jgi:hypothetical protein